GFEPQPSAGTAACPAHARPDRKRFALRGHRPPTRPLPRRTHPPPGLRSWVSCSAQHKILLLAYSIIGSQTDGQNADLFPAQNGTNVRDINNPYFSIGI